MFINVNYADYSGVHVDSIMYKDMLRCFENVLQFVVGSKVKGRYTMKAPLLYVEFQIAV